MKETSSSVSSPARLFVSMSAFRKHTYEKRLPTPLMAVMANGTLMRPSMLVFITRKMCWNFSGMISADLNFHSTISMMRLFRKRASEKRLARRPIKSDLNLPFFQYILLSVQPTVYSTFNYSNTLRIYRLKKNTLIQYMHANMCVSFIGMFIYIVEWDKFRAKLSR